MMYTPASSKKFWQDNMSILLFYSSYNGFLQKGPFTNYVDKILAFFDHLTPWFDIFYGINVDIFGPPTYLIL